MTAQKTTKNASAPDREPAAHASAAAQFAAELRALRERAGSPSYRDLARAAHFSVSTIADATSGKRMPTEQVVRGFAAACHESPDLWAGKLRQAADRAAASSADSTGTPQSAADGEPLRRLTLPRPGRRAVQSVTAIALLGAGYAAGAFHQSGAAGTAGMNSTPGIQTHGAAVTHVYPAVEGSDPVTAGCTDDAQLIDKSPLVRDGVQIGAVELKYSPRCAAGWARAYLYPAAGPLLGGTFATIGIAAADGTATSITAKLVNQMPDYTDVIIPHGGCLSAGVVLAPASPRPDRAATACDPLGAKSATPSAAGATP
jgi:transcriptional regulator with XRE-family HTH domain